MRFVCFVDFEIGCYLLGGPNEADMSCVVVEPRMGTVALQLTCWALLELGTAQWAVASPLMFLS